ncbi:Band 7 protein [Plakobranchus ocellatus]|uniref:Band 7 protein n=1 Tax=Plakobranchus ocellatus TaxID=259542 RepID=A0AAV3YDN2_9GAST|nr:Band 7 protein [Plakobranchus ocellatus]
MVNDRLVHVLESRNLLSKWVSDNGFRFSVSKITCVHYNRQRIYTELALHLDGQPIPVKGIRGNENVDKLAKAALNRASCSGKRICWSDLKPKINAYIRSVWQKNWDAEGANEVFPNLGEDLHRRGEGAGRKREIAMCRLRVIAAEGEFQASQSLQAAAEVIAKSPSALHLRYLQTLNTISAEKNSTVIFPFPIEFIKK